MKVISGAAALGEHQKQMVKALRQGEEPVPDGLVQRVGVLVALKDPAAIINVSGNRLEDDLEGGDLARGINAGLKLVDRDDGLLQLGDVLLGYGQGRTIDHLIAVSVRS